MARSTRSKYLARPLSDDLDKNLAPYIPPQFLFIFPYGRPYNVETTPYHYLVAIYGILLATTAGKKHELARIVWPSL